MLGSLTLIAVIRGTAPDAASLERFATVLLGCAGDVETVLVADDPAPEVMLALKALAACVPDLTVVVLSGAGHDDVARLVGIEHAVGDAVLFADLARDDPVGLRALLAPLRDGYDLVVADQVADPGGGRERRGTGLYRALFRLVAGVAPDLRPTGLRVLSREAALHVAGRPDAELAIRARLLGASFPATAIRLPGGTGREPGAPGHRWSHAAGLLLSASSLPLRGASYAALAGGALSAVYSLYVFAVFLLKRDVAAGWTTLSLQLSGMMFVFSVVLLFLSEYVIQIHAGAPPRSRRFLVVRELRSPLSRRAQRLNVVDGEGTYQLGRPAWLDR